MLLEVLPLSAAVGMNNWGEGVRRRSLSKVAVTDCINNDVVMSSGGGTRLLVPGMVQTRIYLEDKRY
jgi:hypothetical protein